MKSLIIITISIFFINPTIVSADDIEKFANKLINHYEYDNKINNYLKSFFTSSNSASKYSSKNEQNFSKSENIISKHTVKIKSKNKIVYSFGNGQSLQINPSKINDKIIYNRSPFSFFELKHNSILFGINVDF